MSIWKELSPVDVNAHKERKGKFDYLSWTYAWKYVKDRYPEANYEILDDKVFADGSMEVYCAVTIEGLRHVMWLAVTDFNNRAIQNPSCDAVSNARMRALVKAIGMHGLGFYIYAGESLPQEPDATAAEWEELKKLTAERDAIGVRVFADRVGEHKMTALFNRAKSGEKTAFKETVRDMYRQSKALIDSIAKSIKESVEARSVSELQETLSEIEDREWHYIAAVMGEVEMKRLTEFATEYNIQGVPSGI